MVGVKEAIESLYTHKCDIYEYVKYKNDDHSTDRKLEPVYLNVPCRLSQKTPVVVTISNAPNLSKEVKLFLDTEIKVKAGSKIVVHYNGNTQEFKNSSEPSVYSNHQEITLEIAKEWA